MTRQIITAMFDNRSTASQAVEQLVGVGIDRDCIRMLPQQDAPRDTTATRSSYDYRKDEGGFWASLRDMFLPNEDRATYVEGMHRGGITVIVAVDEARAERASDCLEAAGAVDIDEREAAWREEGWTGYPAPTGASGPGASQTGGQVVSETERIPVVEEELRVGKREVGRGRVRVRSYTVETPAEEQVTLRDERVSVERRPVDRPLRDTESPGMFQDHTIDVEVRGEEPVVAKQARIKEEVVVGKTAEERRETVSDRVRHTEVEVEDERSGRKPLGKRSDSDPL